MNHKIISYALKAHESVNQLYDDKPYAVHLAMVIHYAYTYLHLIPENLRQPVIDACWLHDTMEDCRKTYNDILKATEDKLVTEIVYAVCNEKGKNRKQRANGKYYKGIRETPGAIWTKCFDRFANIKYSKALRSSMWDKYVFEHEDFIKSLFPDENSKIPYQSMITDLDKLVNDPTF